MERRRVAALVVKVQNLVHRYSIISRKKWGAETFVVWFPNGRLLNRYRKRWMRLFFNTSGIFLIHPMWRGSCNKNFKYDGFWRIDLREVNYYFYSYKRNNIWFNVLIISTVLIIKWSWSKAINFKSLSFSFPLHNQSLTGIIRSARPLPKIFRFS